jgi:lipopolysaccharide/colanic/teichoic acid biosynthesis glycosyltransferase
MTRRSATLRGLDLVLTALLAPFALLVGLTVAVAVFLDSPGSVFYRSPRVGRDGRLFAMLKFRTMRTGAAGPSLSAARDERYTPLGRWLATWRLDELPQLWNVLRGQMRLVGPRPELAQFVNAFSEEYDRILRVPPGLTGPSQLAYAEEGRMLADVADREGVYLASILPIKVQIDLRYAQAAPSIIGDLAFVARTLLLPAQRVAGRAWAHAMTRRRPAPEGLGASMLLITSVLALLLVFTLQAAASP